VDLKTEELRCGTPVRMMDIHDGGAGDVADTLVDYNRTVNRLHFERFVRTWGITISSQDITWLLNHMEGFDCAPRHRNPSGRVTP
jgi:hypothetical protein